MGMLNTIQRCVPVSSVYHTLSFPYVLVSVNYLMYLPAPEYGTDKAWGLTSFTSFAWSLGAQGYSLFHARTELAETIQDGDEQPFRLEGHAFCQCKPGMQASLETFLLRHMTRRLSGQFTPY